MPGATTSIPSASLEAKLKGSDTGQKGQIKYNLIY